MIKPSIKLVSATLLIAAAPALWAQDSREAPQETNNSSGLYIGGAYGGYKSHGGEFDDSNDLLAALVGYQFNEFIAVEVDYTDFGNFGEDDVDADLKGFGLGIKGRLPVTDTFGVYARVGAFASAFDVEAFEESETYDDVNPFVGAGVDFQITELLKVFAQYDRYNVDIDEDDFNGQINNDGPDFDTARVGLIFMF